MFHCKPSIWGFSIYGPPISIPKNQSIIGLLDMLLFLFVKILDHIEWFLAVIPRDARGSLRSACGIWFLRRLQGLSLHLVLQMMVVCWSYHGLTYLTIMENQQFWFKSKRFWVSNGSNMNPGFDLVHVSRLSSLIPSEADRSYFRPSECTFGRDPRMPNSQDIVGNQCQGLTLDSEVFCKMIFRFYIDSHLIFMLLCKVGLNPPWLWWDLLESIFNSNKIW